MDIQKNIIIKIFYIPFHFEICFYFAQQLVLSYKKEHKTADAYSKSQSSDALCNP